MHRDFLRFVESQNDLDSIAYIGKDECFSCTPLSVFTRKFAKFSGPCVFPSCQKGRRIHHAASLRRVSHKMLILFSVPIFRQEEFDGLIVGTVPGKSGPPHRRKHALHGKQDDLPSMTERDSSFWARGKAMESSEQITRRSLWPPTSDGTKKCSPPGRGRTRNHNIRLLTFLEDGT
jgi:hypothetical protein